MSGSGCFQPGSIALRIAGLPSNVAAIHATSAIGLTRSKRSRRCWRRRTQVLNPVSDTSNTRDFIEVMYAAAYSSLSSWQHSARRNIGVVSLSPG